MLALLDSLSFEAWLLQTIAMVITAILLPGLKVTSFSGPVFAVFALAFINTHLWSAALFFNIPLDWSTEGLALLVANGVIFWLVIKMVPGIEVSGLGTALIAPVIFTGCSILTTKYGQQVDWMNLVQIIIDFVTNLRDSFLSGQDSIPPAGDLMPTATPTPQALLQPLYFWG
ncbi:MAG: phage holin family protein [Bdellovibrionales bacterium]|nr:phage holin family protein [Bdellovibrionales bacterium]